MSVAAVDQEHRVTPRELFFDLVFVFAFTQVATLLTNDPTFAGIGRAVLVLAALWWAWSAYAWFTNIVDPEESLAGLALLGALNRDVRRGLGGAGSLRRRGRALRSPSSPSARCTSVFMRSPDAGTRTCSERCFESRPGRCSARR